MGDDTIEIILKGTFDNGKIMSIHKILKKPLIEIKEAICNSQPVLAIYGSLRVEDWNISETMGTGYYELIEYLISNNLEFVYRNNNEMLTLNEYKKREKIVEEKNREKYELYKETEPYIDTGIKYMEEENKSSYRKAIKEFTKALNINGNDFNTRYYRALSYYYIGNLQSAKQDLSKLVYDSPNDPEIHYLLGKVYCDDNMFDAAEKEFTVALQYFKSKNKYQINDCIEYLQLIKDIRNNKYKQVNSDISEDEINEEIVKYSADINNENSFAEKKQYVASGLPAMNRGPIAEIWDKVQGLWSYILSENVPWYKKIAPLAALVYLVVPADLIPDVIPVVGLLDDVGVITASIATIGDVINKYMKKNN